MTKRRPAPKRRAKKVVELPPMPLVPVDSERIRQETRAEYDEVRGHLQKARGELDHFHQQDLPKFSQWIHNTFGALLTEIRATTQKLHEQQILLLEIEQEVMFNGVSHLSAYERVMRRRNGQQEEEKKAEQDAEDSDDADEDFDFDFEFDADSGPSFDDLFEEPLPSSKDPGLSRLSEDAATRLKELYRAIVRRLHPDTQKEITPQKLEWWHQAQSAYQQADIQSLELILSLCEIEEAGTTQGSSLSVLKRLILQFRDSLRQIQHQLVKARRDPAWKFSRRKDFIELEKEIRGQLTHDLRMMKEELTWVERQLEAWADPREGGRGRPAYYRRRGRSSMGFY